MLLFWLLVGRYGGPAIYLVLPLTILLLKRKEMYWEMFAGFLFLLILSDSRHEGLEFAKQLKNVYVVLLALFIFFDKNAFQPFNTLYQRFLPFFAIALLCLFFSDNVITGIQKTLSYFLLLLLVPNYVSKLFRDHGTEALKNLVYFGSFLLLVGLILKVVFPDLVHAEGRFTGIFGNPNGLGLFSLLFYLVYAAFEDYYPGLFSKKDKWVIIGVIFLSILLSASRGAIVALMIFLLFKYFFKLSPFIGFFILLIIMLTYEVVITKLPDIIIALNLQEYFRIETLESGSGRLVAWQFAWEHIQHNFFIGKGFAYTELLYKKHYHELSMLGHQGNAHNTYLTFWLNTGLVGLALYLWGFMSFFFQGAKNSRLAFPILFAILFSINMESWLTASLNPFTILLFIILTVISSEEFIKHEAEDSIPVH